MAYQGGAAIQNALNAAEAAQRGNNTGIGNTGAIVELPPGQYLTDRQIIVPDRVQLLGLLVVE